MLNYADGCAFSVDAPWNIDQKFTEFEPSSTKCWCTICDSFEILDCDSNRCIKCFEPKVIED